MNVTVRYFAALRDAAGREHEVVEWRAGTLADLYETLRARHGFAFPRDRLRVALDHEFADWSATPRDGSEVAFVPPVSGG